MRLRNKFKAQSRTNDPLSKTLASFNASTQEEESGMGHRGASPRTTVLQSIRTTAIPGVRPQALRNNINSAETSGVDPSFLPSLPKSQVGSNNIGYFSTRNARG